MKKLSILFLLVSLCANAQNYSNANIPYAPQNGDINSNPIYAAYGFFSNDDQKAVAVAYNDSRIVGWASGYTNLVYGTGSPMGHTVDDVWRTPDFALGAITTPDVYDVVCLGDKGQITLTFDNPIGNGAGLDFAVFENAFGPSFFELAFVEVSTDGIHFVRFPNFYVGETPQTQYSGDNYGEYFYNLAGKYDMNYGTGFDLGELEYAYNYIKTVAVADSSFNQAYIDSFLENYEFVDIDEINFVRIIDIEGSGFTYGSPTYDSSGHVIYDPSPNWGSPGFDLQGVAVLNWGTAPAPIIPEPSTYALIFGLIALAFVIRKKRKQD